jgi:hypothetical protein
MHHACGVSQCDRPTLDIICPLHLRELVLALQRLAGDHKESGLLEELEVTAMRQAKLGGAPIGISVATSTTPMPYHDLASTLRIEVEKELRTWGNHAVATFTHLNHPRRTPRQFAAWLATIPGLLAGLDGVERMHATFKAYVPRVIRMIDRPPATAYLGNCAAPTEDGECPTYLFVTLDDDGTVPPYIRCPSCETAHEVATRQQQMIQKASDVVGTAAEVSKVLARLGITIAASTVRGYAQTRISRGSIIQPRIFKAAEDGGQSLYRVRDVMDAYLTRHGNAA